jgi:hypothetical protein
MPAPPGAKPAPCPGAPGTQFQQPGGAPPKRELVFPSDCVEAITPIMYRRKRMIRHDVGLVEPWRIFMSLRSGLLCESTWALDVLNVLLFDDSSVAYFGLSHLPGLLNLLLDYFQKSLADMFDPNGDDEDGYGWRQCLTADDEADGCDKLISAELEVKRRRRSNQQPAACDLGSVTEPPNPDDRVTLLTTTTTNYTMESRKGLPVKINHNADEDIFVLTDRKRWDHTEDKRYQALTEVGGDPWTAGHTEPDPHVFIMDSFKAEFAHIPFARLLKTKEEELAEAEERTRRSGASGDDTDRTSSNSSRLKGSDSTIDTTTTASTTTGDEPTAQIVVNGSISGNGSAAPFNNNTLSSRNGSSNNSNSSSSVKSLNSNNNNNNSSSDSRTRTKKYELYFNSINSAASRTTAIFKREKENFLKKFNAMQPSGDAAAELDLKELTSGVATPGAGE